MVIKSSLGKAGKDKGNGKQGLMQPVGSQHWEKDAGEVELKDFKYTSGEMENPMHLKKQVDKQQQYIKKNEMKYD